MDSQAELQQLDESLSEMTSLLLSDDAGEDFESAGEFAREPSAPPRREDGPDGADPDETPEGRGDARDAAGQIEDMEAVVAAALEEAAETLEGTPPETRTETTPEAAPPGGDAPDPMAAVAADLDRHAEAVLARDAAAPREGAPESEAVEPDVGTTTPEPSRAIPRASAPAAAALEPGLSQDSAAPVTSTSPAAVGSGPAASPDEAEAAPDAGSAAETIGAPASNRRVWIDLKTRIVAVSGPAGRAVSARGGELLALGIEPLAALLSSRPRVLRQSLAWLALWTAFNAVALWTYLVFFRSTGVEVDPVEVTRILGTEGSPAPGAAAPGLGVLESTTAAPVDPSRD